MLIRLLFVLLAPVLMTHHAWASMRPTFSQNSEFIWHAQLHNHIKVGELASSFAVEPMLPLWQNDNLLGLAHLHVQTSDWDGLSLAPGVGGRFIWADTWILGLQLRYAFFLEDASRNHLMLGTTLLSRHWEFRAVQHVAWGCSEFEMGHSTLLPGLKLYLGTHFYDSLRLDHLTYAHLRADLDLGSYAFGLPVLNQIHLNATLTTHGLHTLGVRWTLPLSRYRYAKTITPLEHQMMEPAFIRPQERGILACFD